MRFPSALTFTKRADKAPANSSIMAQSVAVVIPTWNSAAEIERCLTAVRPQSPAEIVIVDNGSRDDTVARVRALCPEARVIQNTENRGFSAACNQGVANSSAAHVLFLNADAQVDEGYLEMLVATLEGDPRAASAIGKVVYDENGTRYIDSAGISMTFWALRPNDRGHDEPDVGQYDTAGTCFGASGAAALFRRTALDDVGPEYFDEDLFAYYEDVDLAWRLANRGWVHRYEPSVTCHHRRRGYEGKPAAIVEAAFFNRYLVWLKNESLVRFCTYAPLALPWEAARLTRQLMRRPTVLRGFSRVARLAPSAIAKRLRGT